MWTIGKFYGKKRARQDSNLQEGVDLADDMCPGTRRAAEVKAAARSGGSARRDEP